MKKSLRDIAGSQRRQGETSLELLRLLNDPNNPETLQREKARAQKYLDIAGVVMLALDLRGNVTLLNRKGYAILEYSEGELTGRNWIDTCLPEREQSRLRTVFQQLAAGGLEATEHLENWVVTRTGKERLIAWHNSIVLDDNAAPVGTLSSGEDITERRRAEQELMRAKVAAESASRAKSEFLANVSHEIRTPMTAILGFADLLTDCQLSEKDRHTFLRSIRENGESLLALIDGILDLSRIEADKLILEKTDCCLQEILDDVMSTMQIQAEKKTLRLDVECRNPLPERIQTDALRLRQILVNLLGNAVKFTDQGAVRLVVERLQDADTRVRMRFTVSDTGIGIAAEKLADLFQPFTQVDASATRRHGGTGLGLAISKRLAQALDGDIEVASELGKGSTFILTIGAGTTAGVALCQSAEVAPTAQRDRRAVSVSQDLPELPLGGRVLLIEDVPPIQLLLGHILHRMKLDVDCAENGRAGCEMAAKSLADGRPYELILMDIQMPEMDGYEATRRLRSEGWRGPIVALTAHAMVGDREKCLQAGCDDYLAKPLGLSELRGVLARHLTLAGKQCGPCGATPERSIPRGGLLADGVLDPAQVAELMDAFAPELSSRAEMIENAWRGRDRQCLAELTHQLKGTAGLYGFIEVSDLAAEIYGHTKEGQDLALVRNAVVELKRLCQNAAQCSKESAGSKRP